MPFTVALHEIQRIFPVEGSQRENTEVAFICGAKVVAGDLHRLPYSEFVDHRQSSASGNNRFGVGLLCCAFGANDRLLIEIVELRRARAANALRPHRRRWLCHRVTSFPGQTPVYIRNATKKPAEPIRMVENTEPEIAEYFDQATKAAITIAKVR